MVYVGVCRKFLNMSSNNDTKNPWCSVCKNTKRIYQMKINKTKSEGGGKCIKCYRNNSLIAFRSKKRTHIEPVQLDQK